MPDLNVFAPYAQARQAGQRNRLALLQNQLAARRSQNQRMGLLQLEEAMRRKRGEEQRQAAANDPYRQAQIKDLLNRIAGFDAQQERENERLGLYRSNIESLIAHRAKIANRANSEQGPSSPEELTGWITADTMLRRLEELRRLDRTNRTPQLREVSEGNFQWIEPPDPLTPAERKEYEDLMYREPSLRKQRALIAAMAKGRQRYELGSSEETQDDLGDPSAEAIWEAYH